MPPKKQFDQMEQAMRAEWAGRAMGLRALYKALKTVKINNLDLDEILLGTADLIETKAMPIKVVRHK